MKKRYMIPASALAILVAVTVWNMLPSVDPAAYTGSGKAKPPPAGFQVTYTDRMADVVDYFYTTNKELALTFNGMAGRETMRNLLQRLEEHGIRATFFLPGIRVAEEPDIARLILEAGHEIGSNTLENTDVNQLSYEEIYENLRLTNEIFERELGLTPGFVRTKSGDVSDSVRQAAMALNMEAVVSNSINPRDRDMQSAAEIAEYVERFLHRGAVVQLNTHLNPEIVPAIAELADVARRNGYAFKTLRELADGTSARKPPQDIPGYDAASANPDAKAADYEIIHRVPTGRNLISLTFDDWGSERTVSHILDILERYGVKCTFFVNGSGAESNPNLARAIVEAGHEVANHTYNHRKVTDLSVQELQEEIIRAHQAITKAIQQQPVMLFRPPTGEIDDRSARIIAASGYKIIALYDVTAYDWDSRQSAQAIIDTIVSKTEDGSVILLHLHDGIHTIDALPEMIEQLTDRGYRFVKMTELIANRTDSE